MLFVKYSILFFIFLIAGFIGNLFSKKYKNRVEELKSFKEAFNIIESKIKFTYEPLEDIFDEISNLFYKNKINCVFRETKNNMKKMDINTSWKEAIDKNKYILNLNEEDIDTIKKLGNMLGKTDVQGQLSEINLNMNFLDTQITYAEESRKKNEKMYRTLGTIFGLAIVIILI